MPTYTITTLQGRLQPEQKSNIAREITRIHHEVTRAPSFFAQVLFIEVPPGNLFLGGAPLSTDQIFVHGQIGDGRTAEQKSELIRQILAATSSISQTSKFHVWVYIVDLVPAQMAEFGHILPASGKEQEWMAALSREDRERMETIASQF